MLNRRRLLGLAPAAALAAAYPLTADAKRDTLYPTVRESTHWNDTKVEYWLESLEGDTALVCGRVSSPACTYVYYTQPYQIDIPTMQSRFGIDDPVQYIHIQRAYADIGLWIKRQN